MTIFASHIFTLIPKMLNEGDAQFFNAPAPTPTPLGWPDYAVRHRQQKNMLVVGTFMGEGAKKVIASA